MKTEEKSKIVEQFLKLSFEDKKKELLETLKKLFWDSETVNKLWEIVYNANNISEEPILIKIHSLILDAIYYAKDKKSERVIESVKLANESFSVLKQQEEKEKLLTEKELVRLILSI